MTQEYVKYGGIPSSVTPCEILKKQIELQQWILDPTSRPYSNDKKDNRLITARSASTEIPNKSTVQKQLELQQMIISD